MAYTKLVSICLFFTSNVFIEKRSIIEISDFWGIFLAFFLVCLENSGILSDMQISVAVCHSDVAVVMNVVIFS
jgi:hypothetical protein